jgi:hypothetical protein
MKKLIGGILMAIGILIAGASGLCSLVFAIGGLSGGGAELIPLTLVVGGIPFTIGVGLALGGKAIINAARRDEES